MIEIIPAMDLIEGRCVRLTHGDFSRQTVYSDDPLRTAKRFEAAGLTRLHMVDLDGTRAGRPVNISVLENVAAYTSLEIDFSGGLKTERDIEAAFAAGASIVALGTVAVNQPDLFLRSLEKFGSEKVLLAADVKKGMVSIDGWRTQTAIPIIDFLRDFAQRGVSNVFVTDIGRDGAMTGPSIELYREILKNIPEILLTASGGVSTESDIERLEEIGCAGVIVGKALYEGRIELGSLCKYAN